MIAKAVRAVDAVLRRAWRIRDPSDPRALFRLRLARTPRPIALPDAFVPGGATVLEIHLWNERVPRMRDDGPDLGWGARMARATVEGLRAVVRDMDRDPLLGIALAIGGPVVAVSPLDDVGARSVLTRLGFSVFPKASRHAGLEAVADALWANLLVRAFQPGARVASFGVSLAEIWMSASSLRERYGPRVTPAADARARAPRSAERTPGQGGPAGSR